MPKITLSNPTGSRKFLIQYELDGNYFDVVHIKYHTQAGLVDMTDEFEPIELVAAGYLLRLKASALQQGINTTFGFKELNLYPQNFDRHGPNAVLANVLHGETYHWVETVDEVEIEKKVEKELGDGKQPNDPRYDTIANKLKQHEDRFQGRRPGHRRKARFLKETQPEGLSKDKPGLPSLEELNKFKKTSGEFNTLEKNDYLAASAYHRLFPTRQYILPKNFGILVRENPVLQNKRVLELWIDHYKTRLNHRLRYKGRKKASEVAAAWRNAKAEFGEASIDEPTPDQLVNLLTTRKPGQKSLIDAIAMPRTHRWSVGRLSYGFEKLFKDFPVLKDYKEYLRLQVWIKQYCESLEKSHFHAKPEKVKAIIAALDRANTAAKATPYLKRSLYSFLNYRDPNLPEPSLLDAIQEKRNPDDLGVTHGYEMLCKEFKELKLLKWLKNYCQLLRLPHSGLAGKKKAMAIEAAQARANQYAAQNNEVLSPEEFLKLRIDGNESILIAINRKRKNVNHKDEHSRGYLRMCRELQLNVQDLDVSDIEMSSNLYDDTESTTHSNEHN